MRIAVISDVHDNIWNLSDALDRIAEQEAGALIFCGDFCAPFTLAQIGQDFNGPVHCVFGNNDGDPRLLLANAQAAGNVTLHGEFAELAFDGRRVAVNHYPEIAQYLARSGEFDLVCYGHNHQAKVERMGKTILANPGEVMGRFGDPTYGIYDSGMGDFSLHPVLHHCNPVD
ncbi:MAG: metallophosphoesterase [Chloroflexota bacterium]|nr:metallophosphoesterase [Chloroflexota bacterium]